MKKPDEGDEMNRNNLISFALGCIGNKILKHRQLKKFRRHIIETQDKMENPLIFLFKDDAEELNQKDTEVLKDIFNEDKL